MSDYENGLSHFFGVYCWSIVLSLILFVLTGDVRLLCINLIVLFVASIVLSILFFGFSKSGSKSYRVIISTVDSVYIVGRGLSWDKAKELRDYLVCDYSTLDRLLIVKCTYGSTYGVRAFNKQNIVHIGWLED